MGERDGMELKRGAYAKKEGNLSEKKKNILEPSHVNWQVLPAI